MAGGGGRNLSNLVAAAAALDANLALYPNATPVLYVDIGHNDWASDPNTYAASLASYCGARRTAGWKVLLATMLPGFDPASANGIALNNFRNTLNAITRTWVGTNVDGIADIAADPIIGDPNVTMNAAYWNADTLHPNAPAYNIMYTIVAPKVNALTTTRAQPAAYTPWNAADKDAAVSLSASDYIMQASTRYKSVRAARWRDTGKWYTEFTVATERFQGVGLCDFNSVLSSYPSAIRSVVLYYGGPLSAAGFSTPATFTWGGGSFPWGINNPGPNIWSYYVDFDAGKLWVALNGVWTGSGDPQTAANPYTTFDANALLTPCAFGDPAGTVQLPANVGALVYPSLATGAQIF